MNNIRIKTTNCFLLIFLVSYIGLSFLTGILLADADVSYAVLMLISEGVLLLPVVVFLICKRVNPLRMDFMKLPKLWDVILSYIFAYTLMPLIYLINILTMTFADNPVQDMMGSLYEYPLWLQLVLAALLPALVEEFIFRGIFFTSYRKRNILGAAVLSGVIFGLIHLNVNQCAYAIVMGIAFALLVEASGSIGNSVAAHFAINANSVFMMAAITAAQGYEEYVEEAEQSAQQLQNMGVTGIPVLAYAVITAFAVGGIAIALCILRKIAARNERTGHMKNVLLGFREKQEGTDPFFDIFMIAVFAIAIAFMAVSL
jgi:hypothetical protein